MQVPIYITGLVMGPLKLDHKGQSQVVCKATGNRAKLCISNQGTLSRMWKGNNHQVPETPRNIKARCRQQSSCLYGGNAYSLLQLPGWSQHQGDIQMEYHTGFQGNHSTKAISERSTTQDNSSSQA